MQQTDAKLTKLLLTYAKFRLQKDSNFIEKVSKFKLFTIFASDTASGHENQLKRAPTTLQAPHKAPQRSPGALRSALAEPQEPPQTTSGALSGEPWASKRSTGRISKASGLHF